MSEGWSVRRTEAQRLNGFSLQQLLLGICRDLLSVRRGFAAGGLMLLAEIYEYCLLTKFLAREVLQDLPPLNFHALS